MTKSKIQNKFSARGGSAFGGKIQILKPKNLFCYLVFVCFIAYFVICALTFGILAQGEVAKMKKVVMIIASSDFRDEELLEPREVLERNGIEVKIASTTLNQIKGMLGEKVKPDLLTSDIKIKDFDAIVFVGGVGASEYWDDPVAHKLAQDAVNTNRVVGAICIAPVTLAKAGILAGKRATVFSSEAAQLKANGANYTGKAVEKDGNIITANGPSAAREFAGDLVKTLNK